MVGATAAGSTPAAHTFVSLQMEYSWIVLAWVGPELEERLLKSDVVSVEPNPGFLKPLGVVSERAYRPWVVKPYIEVWQEIGRKINRETGGKVVGRSQQLTIQASPGASPRRYNFNLRFYRPGTLCVEVRLVDDIGGSTEEFFAYRQLENHPWVPLVVDCLIGIISTGQLTGYPTSNSYSAKPAMLMSAPVGESDFEVWRDNTKEELVGLLINNKHFDRASDYLIQKIFEKNKEMDVKYAKSVLSMISKQGVITVYPSGGDDLARDINREHIRRFRFLEYALALQKFVEKYRDIRSDNRERAEFLLFLCMPFLSEKANLPKTVTGTNTWRILAEEFSLERSVGALEKTYLLESDSKEDYYVSIQTRGYDSLDYMDNVYRVTRPHRNWIRKDFTSNKIIAWTISTAVAIFGAILAYLKFGS
ncbi:MULTISPECIES: hypothetical protein [unclassified Mesorhizobium]|uniref:hypothetical protein n=1 Tax=unclassified Mesorhizobium TaxID=325217 RepID=UPI0004246281|nr:MULTISPECIES: hypothetical protein [unclassified Mesorhizobium]WJI72879.1 hypothetical protein NLY37_17740 [Mesorhizobium sp. C395A]